MDQNVQALISNADAGRRVLVIASDYDQAMAVFKAVKGTKHEGIVRTSRAKGREQIEWASGGSVRFIPYSPERVRGLGANVVYLAGNVENDNPEILDDVRTILATTPAAVVLREVAQP